MPGIQGCSSEAIITDDFLAFSNIANERLRREKQFVPKVGMVPMVSYNEESGENCAFHAIKGILAHPCLNGYTFMDENDARFLSDLFLYNRNTQHDNNVFKYR